MVFKTLYSHGEEMRKRVDSLLNQGIVGLLQATQREGTLAEATDGVEDLIGLFGLEQGSGTLVVRIDELPDARSRPRRSDSRRAETATRSAGRTSAIPG